MNVGESETIISQRFLFEFKMENLEIQPNVVVILSGKRKSGKDFVASKLKDILGHDKCDVIRLSWPLKYEYARRNGLEFDRLLDTSPYKEVHRLDMIRWGEEKRKEDPSLFCRLAVQMTLSGIDRGNGLSEHNGGSEENATRTVKPIWIVSDARRKTDLMFFEQTYRNVIKVRIYACDTIRRHRGWIFTAGVDDAESECALDDQEFDIVIQNNGNEREFDNCFNCLQGCIHPFFGDNPEKL